jgi:holo-[acyl-carrier protein] synthase
MCGIGTDIVNISRIAHWTSDNDILDFVFTHKEKTTVLKRKYAHRHFAVIFAAKEAFMKAIGMGWGEGVRWKDIEVFDDDGRLLIQPYNMAQDVCGNRKIFVSADCTGDIAVAIVAID